MERRALGQTDLQVSVIGFGSAPIGYLESEQTQVERVVGQMLDAGVNLIDTAAVYPGSEEAVGKALVKRRDDCILVSKCGPAFDDLEGEAWSPKLLSQTVDRSLKRLRTDHLDVMLLHSCDLETLKQGDAVGALVDAREAGKIRIVGYSGDNEAANYAAGLDELAVIETSINICDQANIESVLPQAQQRNVGVIAKRPIANAAWKEESVQQGIYKKYAQTYAQRLSEMQLSPADLGFESDDDWPEIALRFTLSLLGVHTAIIGTTDADHAAANLRAAEKGPLPDEAIVKLRTAFRTAEAKSGETWKAET